MIPRIIHQIWFQGKNDCPHLDNCDTWKRKNADYQYMFWDEAMMRELITSKYPQYYDTWNKYNYMHQKIDFFKYLLMDYYGGIYADIDAVCLKSFDDLLAHDGVVVSGLNTTKLESSILFGSTDSVNNGIILSSRGHPFWRGYIEDILQQKGPWLTKFNEINNTTGPAFFSKSIYGYKGDGITVLNHSAFEPCFSGDPYCKVGEDSYADHQHSQTWINPIMKWLSNIYCHIRHYWIAVVILIAFVTFVFLGR